MKRVFESKLGFIRRRPAFAAGAVFLLFCACAAAQTDTNAVTNAAATSEVPVQVVSENLIPDSVNGELTTVLPNLWDGVDSENCLRVNVAASRVLDDAGRMLNSTMSSCPNFKDMNGDGLPDLVVSDTRGFLWIYPNSGEKGKPAFTTGTFVPTFIGWGAKIHVCDWDGDDDNDILFGTFYGDIGILLNIGTRTRWQFTTRMGVPRYVDPQFGIEDTRNRVSTILLGTKPMVLGNYISPWVHDWDGDGKQDLIMGEGTYSANSVRLALNTGSRNKPIFTEERVFYLCYGDGFEHLTPAVLDYNGDGIPDLIVGTRTGQIRLYKGSKKAVDGKDMVAAIQGTLAPAILEFTEFVRIAGKEVFSPMSFVFPCDWNEDGRFDLLLGATDGRIYIAVNDGSKTEFRFPRAEPVRGTDVEMDLLAPSGWRDGTQRIYWDNYFGGYGNSAVMLSAEREVVINNQTNLPVSGEFFLYCRYVKDYPGYTLNNLAWVRPIYRGPVEHVIGAKTISPYFTTKSSDGFVLEGIELKLNSRYELSFSSIVIGKPVMWGIWAWERVKDGTDDVDDEYETHDYVDMIPVSTTWRKGTYRFKCPSTYQPHYHYKLYFRMPEGDVKFMLDDLSLKEISR